VADLNALQAGVACAYSAFPNFRLDQLWVEITYQNLGRGTYGTDRLTNQATPTFAGTTTFNAARVDVLEGGVVIATDNGAVDHRAASRPGRCARPACWATSSSPQRAGAPF
jgi:hypothetical protein